LLLLAGQTCLLEEIRAQHVGIGEPFPLEKLHVNGNLRLDGDTLMGNRSSPASVLHVLSNGGVSVKLDANDDGSERFSIKKSGPDLGSVVFEVSEAGNTTADGYGDFNGYGRFNGNFTLDGDSRKLFTGENFDVVADGSIEFYLDANADNASSDFGILNDAGEFLFLVEEDKNPTLYPFGPATGQTGGIRFRELAAGGSSFIGIRAPDGLSGNVWLTLPTTDGLPGQVLQTDGAGVLSWVNPALLLGAARPGAAGPEAARPGAAPMEASGSGGWVLQELTLRAGDSVGLVMDSPGPCWLAGQHALRGGGASQTTCSVLPPDPSGRVVDAYGAAGSGSAVAAELPSGAGTAHFADGRGFGFRTSAVDAPSWMLSGSCRGDCTRLVCQVLCWP
jgi:hypothetical protein